jgi:hypothetical protein
MGPRNAYKDILDNVVSPITYVSMNHQNQLEQMANEAKFATKCMTLVVVLVYFSWWSSASNVVDEVFAKLVASLQQVKASETGLKNIVY